MFRIALDSVQRRKESKDPISKSIDSNSNIDGIYLEITSLSNEDASVQTRNVPHVGGLDCASPAVLSEQNKGLIVVHPTDPTTTRPSKSASNIQGTLKKSLDTSVAKSLDEVKRALTQLQLCTKGARKRNGFYLEVVPSMSKSLDASCALTNEPPYRSENDTICEPSDSASICESNVEEDPRFHRWKKLYRAVLKIKQSRRNKKNLRTPTEGFFLYDTESQDEAFLAPLLTE